eukprot:jgi/Orpsp1_1/1188006/evm.model.d7180000061796.1
MRNIIHLLYIFAYGFILNFIKNVKCEDSIYKRENYTTKFSLDFVDFYGKSLDRINLKFDPDIQKFDNEELLNSLEEDINKKENEKNTILFWNTSTAYSFRTSIIYLSVFPIWYNEQKKISEKPFCMRIDSVG